jgi:hypothetical protein
MVTFLITSLFILGFLAVAIYFWQRPAAPDESEVLPPAPERRVLFEGEHQNNQVVEDAAIAEAQRKELLSLAAEGEHSALQKAKDTGNAGLYDEVLNCLVAEAEGPKLLSLTSYISRHELTINKSLAEKVIESWLTAPDRGSTAKMLHLAALSDDAATYRTAVEATLQCWRDGQISTISAEELQAIIDGEFWILSSGARSSGAGFLLKQTLASARRELETARAHNQTPHTE